MTMLTPRRAEEVHDVLVAACDAVGIDPTGAQLITYSSNVVYRLPRAAAVVRLHLHPDVEHARRLVRAAAWLHSENAPIAPLLPSLDQPVLGDGWSGTFWTEQERVDGARYADLAEPLRAVHALAAPRDLPKWDKVAYARRQLANARGVHKEDLDWLTEAWTQVDRDYQAIAAEIPHGVIHGDAHPGNLLRTRGGRVVLCDLDNVAHGPTDWDLTPSAISAIRFGTETDQRYFVDAYGRDVTLTPWWPTLRRIRELVMVTYLVPDLANRPAMIGQWQHRMHTLRAGDDNIKWDRF